VQQAVLAFKQALEAAMKGQGPMPLIEISQEASSITAAAAAAITSSNALLSSSGSGVAVAAHNLISQAPGCSSNASGKQKHTAVAAAAAAASSQQLFAKGGWMDVFRGKLGKAAAKLVSSSGSGGLSGSGSSMTAGAVASEDTQGGVGYELLEALGIAGPASTVLPSVDEHSRAVVAGGAGGTDDGVDSAASSSLVRNTYTRRCCGPGIA
jgi:hypothetical protein